MPPPRAVPKTVAPPPPEDAAPVARCSRAFVALTLVAAAPQRFPTKTISSRACNNSFRRSRLVDLQAEFNAAFEDLEAGGCVCVSRSRDWPRVDAIERTLGALRASVDKLSASEQNVEVEVVKQLNGQIALLEAQAGAATGLAQQFAQRKESAECPRHRLEAGDGCSGRAIKLVQWSATAAALSSGNSPPCGPMAATVTSPRHGRARAVSATGVPACSVAALRARLPATIDGVIRATRDRSDTWTEPGWLIGSLHAVRRVGSGDRRGRHRRHRGAGGNRPGRWGSASCGDGAGAAGRRARRAAADWLQHARARLTADRALSTLQQRALARLATARGWGNATLGLLIVILGVAAFIAASLAQFPGDVSLTWRDWRISTSAGVFIAAMLVLSAIAALLYRLWWSLRKAPRMIERARRERRQRLGYEALGRVSSRWPRETRRVLGGRPVAPKRCSMVDR